MITNTQELTKYALRIFDVEIFWDLAERNDKDRDNSGLILSCFLLS